MTTTIIEALRAGLTEQLVTDDRVFVMGEDVGIGGSFHLTLGMRDEFGAERIRDTPVSEAGFVGLAIGAAIAGMRPVVDFQYADFLLCAANQVIQHAAKMSVMSGGQVDVPIVLHAPTGASGRGAQHANSVENYFYGVPGLTVAVPSTAYAAKGVMTTALRSEGPVLIFGHKYLYGSKGRALVDGDGVVSEVPSEPYEVPIGQARVVREGRHLTIVAALLMVHRATEAAARLAREGIEVEVIDMCWLSPLDTDTVVASVERTGGVLIVEEGPGRGGWGGSVAAAVADRALTSLDLPVRRLTGPDEPLPFAPHLEKDLIPDTDAIVEEVHRMLGGA